jgi:hypothetical protein
VQAVFFGFSMLRPWLFPILLGINFGFTIQRQNKEHARLAVFLYNAICKPHERPDPDKFRVGLKKLLDEDFSELSGWRPIGWLIYMWAGIISIMGLVVGYLVVELPVDWPLQNIWELRTNWYHKEILITIEVLFVTVVTTIYGWGVLKRRARFLMSPIKKADDQEEESAKGENDRDNTPKQKERLKIDEQFDCLQRKLAELCTG